MTKRKPYSSWFPKKCPPISFGLQAARYHVWIGESLQTRSGLKKKDLVMIDGKIKSRKMSEKKLKVREESEITSQLRNRSRKTIQT